MKYAYSDGPSTNGGNSVVQWPPPPAHTYLFNSGRTIVSPPKPDTPPTHVSQVITLFLFHKCLIPASAKAYL